MSEQVQQPEQKHPDPQLFLTLIQSLVNLVTGLAWPIVALIFLSILVGNAPNIFRELRSGGNVEASFGTSGLTIKIFERVQNGLIEQATAPPLPGGASKSVTPDTLAEISRLSAAVASNPPPVISMTSAPKVLWIDDRPEGNTGLTKAIKALGIDVVSVEDNSQISVAFQTAKKFDIVITDMSRDRPKDHRAGLKTVEIIKSKYPDVPVIIFAGRYGSEHKHDKLETPIVLITDNPQQVLDMVFRLTLKRVNNSAERAR
jgi:CheY-like chemotaxis protein